MISSVLSRIFLWLFVIVTIGASGNLIADIVNRPIEIKVDKKSRILLGKPGITKRANLSNVSIAQSAPDTTIVFSVKDSLGHQLFSGSYSYGNNVDEEKWDFEKENELRFLSYVKDARLKSQDYKLDTQLSLIGSQNLSLGNLSDNATSTFSDLDDGRVLYTYEESNSKNESTDRKIRDTFYNEAAAKRFDIMQHWKKNGNEISQTGETSEVLRVMPKNRFQHILFVAFHLIVYSGFTILLLLLHKLFKRFSQKYFFEIENVTAIKFIGWCLLIPGLIGTFFSIYLALNVFPQKVTFKYGTSGNSEFVQNYQFDTHIEWWQIFLGLGLIVLSYIFKQGLELKEDQDLTV
jgi:Protein of unknown function (DUF2975)